MTSKPLVRRTFATLRSAEFGFLGVVVYTRVHTPRFCGEPASAGTLLLAGRRIRALRTNWLIVGIISGPKKPGRPVCEKRPSHGVQRPRILAGKSAHGQQVIAF